MGALFLGTPAAAVPSLAALADIEDIDLVITQPDRRTGRGRGRSPSPVKVAAQQFGYSVSQPESRKELGEIIASGDFNVGVVVAYGRILTPRMIGAVPFGFLNIHFSLLPRWRGAAPVERAIAAGDERTGVTLMKIDEGLDTGPVLAEIATPIAPDETGGSLTARLSFLGASLLDRSAPEYLNGRRRPVPQITAGVLHAKSLTKSEAQLRADASVSQAERMVRAFQPRPTAWMETSDGSLRIHAAKESGLSEEPGRITEQGSSVVAGFADGTLEITVVQPADKARMPASDWMNGRRGQPVSFV